MPTDGSSSVFIEPEIYRQRFTQKELQAARAFWIPICRYLEQFLYTEGATLDLGAGYCHFINNVRSKKKYALDLSAEHLLQHAASDVETIEASASRLDRFPDSSLDSVFASNLYEHFQSREDVACSFREVRRVLKPKGRFIVLQPNFAYCARRYFDFFDHRLPFTDRGMVEGLEMAELNIVRVVPRFLPYTSKSSLPTAPWMVALYLKFPPIWRILGAQMLIVAEKAPAWHGFSGMQHA
jgi:SAM-dependent methyltransferase